MFVPTTEDDLQQVQEALRSAEVEHERRRVERLEVMRRASSEGWSHERIAAALGLTRARVGQILAGRER